jgi:hypothetical protein
MKAFISALRFSVLGAGLLLLPAVLLVAAEAKIGAGKNFMFPDYYPASNGVRRLKSVVAGEEARFVSNSVIALKNPKLTNFTPETKVEWTATTGECTVNIGTREVNGSTNLVFQTADERLFLSGEGFLWQQSRSLLILSNNVFTWIDKTVLTNKPSTK